MQQVLRKHDVLMIADEVICSFGRTGNMFGCETFAIVPDIMTVAKSLSSAYLPISATIINEELCQGLASNSEPGARQGDEAAVRRQGRRRHIL